VRGGVDGYLDCGFFAQRHLHLFSNVPVFLQKHSDTQGIATRKTTKNRKASLFLHLTLLPNSWDRTFNVLVEFLTRASSSQSRPLTLAIASFSFTRQVFRSHSLLRLSTYSFMVVPSIWLFVLSFRCQLAHVIPFWIFPTFRSAHTPGSIQSLFMLSL